jgi:glutamate carboxypeptidase
MTTALARLIRLRDRLPDMVDSLAALVEAESPSADIALLDACAAVASSLGADATGSPAQVVRVERGRPHLQWRFGTHTKVVLLGHFDTVWPAGTTARWPFAFDGDRATGPGVFDMKAGIVQLFEALATLDDLDGVSVLLTSDEETGSLSSRRIIEGSAHQALAALVCEPSGAGGALKTARKGTGMYTLRVTGRAAHAGLEPERGANALVEAAHLVLASLEVARPDLGTTVVPTLATAGTASNVVPPVATVELDVRVAVPDEAARVDTDLRRLTTTVPGTTVTVEGGPNRPPMPASASSGLFARAQAAAETLGLTPLTSVEVGGASDGNFAAGVGTPTLDGLGAVGDHLHAEGEYTVVAAMAERAALLAELVAGLLSRH